MQELVARVPRVSIRVKAKCGLILRHNPSFLPLIEGPTNAIECRSRKIIAQDKSTISSQYKTMPDISMGCRHRMMARDDLSARAHPRILHRRREPASFHATIVHTALKLVPLPRMIYFIRMRGRLAKRAHYPKRRHQIKNAQQKANCPSE